MIWHDGEVIPDDVLRVEIDDRVFEHGLGLFETFRSWGGHAPLLARHLDRLRDSARALGIALDGVRLPDRGAVMRLVEVCGMGGDALLRLTLTAGSELGRPPVAWLRAGPLPPPEDLPIRAVMYDEGRSDPPVSRHKMLNYWGRRMAYEFARGRGADEAILASAAGELREGSRNNILIVPRGRPRTIATPDLGAPILPGIMRRAALDFAEACGYAIEERRVALVELFEAEAAFLTNSVRGVRPIGRIDGRRIAGSLGHELTRRFAEVLPDYLLASPDSDRSPPS